MDESLKRLLAGIFGVVVAAVMGTAPETPAPAGAAEQRPAAAAQLPGVGVGSHSLQPRAIRELTDLGVRHVRHTIEWRNWSYGPYRQEKTAGIRRAAAAGLEILIVVHYQPRGGYSDRHRIYREYAAFMEGLAREFPEVGAWQLWNEMDSEQAGFTDIFGAGHGVPMRQRGLNYAEMLRLAYPAVKRGNPNALVVTGGVWSNPASGFIQGIYDGGGLFDALAIHSYGFPLVRPFRDRGLEARRVMRANGDDRPLWNTEFGMEAAVIPPGWDRSRAEVDRHHLEAWRESLLLNDRERIYDRAYGHVLQQGGDLGHDLVRLDGSPRPAYTWLRGWLRTRGS